MKKFVALLFGLFSSAVWADDVVNVKYIHEMLEHEYGVFVPYADTLTDDTVVANMQYLLKVVDIANEFVTGVATTYSAGEYATQDAADTVVVRQAFDTLLKEVVVIDHEYPFELSLTATGTFSFTMSAMGEFFVDWGDGNLQTITKNDTANTTYSHSYSGGASYKFRLGGVATDYNDDVDTATISFANNAAITSIAGNLSMVFPTLDSGENPRFYNTFSGLSGVSGALPANLFIDLTGNPVPNMFRGTFSGTDFRGAIPEKIFGTLTGAPAEGMFYETFRGLGQLTNAIPATLFSGITGAPATDMFRGTFYGCMKLRGNVPSGLFAGIGGAPAPGMFSQTFMGCTKLSGIDAGVFGNLSGDAQTDMFTQMFANDNKLYGYSPQINGQYLYQIWPNATSAQVGGAFKKCQKLTDYSSIPNTWR